MLSKVLDYLRSAGIANVSTISRKLDIEEGTVIMLLDQLVKRGYLEEMEITEEETDFCTPSKCSNCSKSTSCDDIYKIKYRLVK